jgi:hypothetical protein
MSKRSTSKLLNEWDRVRNGLWYEEYQEEINKRLGNSIEFLKTNPELTTLRHLQGQIHAYETIKSLPERMEKKWLGKPDDK